MIDRYQLIAYVATLITLVIVFVSALVAAVVAPGLIGRLEAFGLGTITGGLIGILRIPTSQRASASVGTADSVNVTPAPESTPS